MRFRKSDFHENVFVLFQTIFLTIALLPLRLAAITTLMILAWLLACLGLHGLSEEDLRRTPLKGWRRYGFNEIKRCDDFDPLFFICNSSFQVYLYYAIYVNINHLRLLFNFFLFLLVVYSISSCFANWFKSALRSWNMSNMLRDL